MFLKTSVLSGIPENLIEDVKVSNCYFGQLGLPTMAREGFGATPKPMPDWHTLRVPGIEDAYPQTLFFGATPCHGFFVRHLKNLEMSHGKIAPTNPEPRPAFWMEDTHRQTFSASRRLRSRTSSCAT
jgi:hypothetical protein